MGQWDKRNGTVGQWDKRSGTVGQTFLDSGTVGHYVSSTTALLLIKSNIGHTNDQSAFTNRES